MTTKNIKYTIVAILAISLSIAGMSQGFAETDEERINRLGKQGYELHLQLEDTTNAKARDTVQKQFDNVLRQLEYYGITTIEKAEAEPDYWAVRSSQYQSGELNEVSPVANFLLPTAYAVDSPDFQLGYEHDFWVIFSWHQWTGDWITITEFNSDDDAITLVDDHDWIKAKWQVRGSNIEVDHIYDYDLKDGTTIKQNADGTKNTIHNGNQIVRVISMSQYNSSPQQGWVITTDWTVQSINDWP